MLFHMDFNTGLFLSGWNLTDEWTNTLLAYETDLYSSPYETTLSRYTLLLPLHCCYSKLNSAKKELPLSKAKHSW